MCSGFYRGLRVSTAMVISSLDKMIPEGKFGNVVSTYDPPNQEAFWNVIIKFDDGTVATIGQPTEALKVYPLNPNFGKEKTT